MAPRGLWQLNPDVRALHFDSEVRLRQIGVQAMPACGDIKLPAVPGTGDDATIQLPLGQRTTSMRADSIERVEGIGGTVQGDDAAACDELFSRAFRDFVDGCNSNPM